MYQDPDFVYANIVKSWSPPPALTVSEWADTYGILTAGTAEPGRWTSIPYQVAIMDAFTQPEIQNVVFMKSKRLGWTKIVGHIFGYHVHIDPASMLIVQPTVEDANSYSKEEIQPVIDDTDALSKLVATARTPGAGNTIRAKQYAGQMLHLVGANSPRGFRRITVRIVLFDEIDGYPEVAGVEGDQIKLGMGRTETFWNRKHGLGSTPTTKDLSRIEKHFNLSSRGYPLLTCPHCHGTHIRRFAFIDEKDKKYPEVTVRDKKLPISHIVWKDNEPRTARWLCPQCSQTIDYRHHRHMIDGLRWVGDHWDWNRTNGFTFLPGFSGTIGFHCWAGYSMSPNSTPMHLVAEYLEAKENPKDMIVFINTVLGETWQEEGKELDATSIESRVEKYAAEVPKRVLFLSAGVDIQQDRIEIEIVGWGLKQEAWSIDHVILPGEPSKPKGVWDDLKTFLSGPYKHENGHNLYVRAVGVDRGYLPNMVDLFISEVKRSYYWGLVGRSGFHRSIIESPEVKAKRLRRMKKHKAPREIIGVDDAKLTLYLRLNSIKKPGPGFIHFGEHCDHEYFAQLGAEKLITNFSPEGMERKWVKTRPRGEVLDCWVYAYAAFLLAEPALRVKAPVKTTAIESKSKVQQKKGSSNFVARW